MLSFWILAGLGMLSSGMADKVLIQSTIVSRHGVRTPYAPPFGTVDDFTAYTQKPFPTAEDWGMTQTSFENQDITPHGATLIPLLGSYYKSYYENLGLDFSDCSGITVYADDSSEKSTRDLVTAQLWMQGFGCPDVEIALVNKDNNVDMQPVLSDHFDVGCPLATQEQADGLFGGDVNALTDMYYDGIMKVNEILDVPTDAAVCKDSDPTFPDGKDCTLADTGVKFTGVYYEGEYTSPLYYAQYFPEAWMLQYVSNIPNWGFGLLTLKQLTDLYNMHIKTMSMGTNHWNSQAYSSQQLAYIVLSLAQRVENKKIAGVNEDISNRLLLLVSHDTNIMFLANLLDLNWIPMGYGNNVASTGGCLHFELYQDSDSKEYFVKVHYDAASPDQQRNAEELTLANPPSIASLVIPACGALYCPWEKFVEIALGVINMDCVQSPVQASSQSLYSSVVNPSNDDNKHGLTNDDWGLIISTVSVCIAVGVVIMVVLLYSWRDPNVSADLLKEKAQSQEHQDSELYNPLVSQEEGLLTTNDEN